MTTTANLRALPGSTTTSGFYVSNEVLMHQDNVTIPLKGRVRIYPEGCPSSIFYDSGNDICNTVKSLFARLMASSVEPKYGIWGLALGSGLSAWEQTPEQQQDPIPGPEHWRMYNEIVRKKVSFVRFVDSDLTPLREGFSERVSFQTVVNKTTDGIQRSIRELGLVGGGSTSLNTTMESARYWDPTLDLATGADGKLRSGYTKPVNQAEWPEQTVTLINYLSTPRLDLPDNINFIFEWILAF
jgi:hypothetical protein